MISRAPAPVISEVLEVKKSEVKDAGTSKKRLPVGLIVVINVVILVAVLLVVLVMRPPSPASVKMPTVTPPKVPAPGIKP